MRNLGNHMIMALMWVVIFTMFWLLHGVVAQPAYGDEKPILKQEILKPGYMPKTTRGSQLAPKRFSRVEGYIHTPQTGVTRHVELRSYTYGNQTYYTGRVGRSTVQGSLKSHKVKPLEK